MSGDMKKQEIEAIHGLFANVAEFMDVELEGTAYRSHGVYPHSVNRRKDEHKKAIYLLSETFAGSPKLPETDSVMQEWDYPEEPGPEISSGQVDYFADSEKDRVVIDDAAEVEITHNGREAYQWTVLEGLSQGEELGDILEEVYSRKDGLVNRLYSDINDEVLDEGVLPNEYRDDLGELIDDYRASLGTDPVSKLTPETHATGD